MTGAAVIAVVAEPDACVVTAGDGPHDRPVPPGVGGGESPAHPRAAAGTATPCRRGPMPCGTRIGRFNRPPRCRRGRGSPPTLHAQATGGVGGTAHQWFFSPEGAKTFEEVFIVTAAWIIPMPDSPPEGRLLLRGLRRLQVIQSHGPAWRGGTAYRWRPPWAGASARVPPGDGRRMPGKAQESGPPLRASDESDSSRTDPTRPTDPSDRTDRSGWGGWAESVRQVRARYALNTGWKKKHLVEGLPCSKDCWKCWWTCLQKMGWGHFRMGFLFLVRAKFWDAMDFFTRRLAGRMVYPNAGPVYPRRSWTWLAGWLHDGCRLTATRDKKWQTPLMLAVDYAQPYCAALYLLSWGADPNLSDKDGTTALHIACTVEPDLSMICLLVGHGADVTVRNAEGKTPEQSQ